MATMSLETPKKTVQFDSLTHLRDELRKQSKNPERLDEFQKTIDRAIKDGEKKGIIEFSEDEWKSLISKEGLPPLEEVKKILEDKIRAKTESTEKRKWIIEELKDKAEETKKSFGEKAEGLKSTATGKMQEWKEKAEKLKGFSKPAIWMLGIGLSLKLWGYKIGNWFSGLLGKKGAYDDGIKKIEMEQEFMKDPKAAMEKYGAEAKEKLASETGGVVEKGKEVLEKIPGIAGLSVMAISIFALLKKFLPKSLTANIDEKDGVSILKMARKWNILKYLGAGGLALWGASTLYAHTTENPNAVTSLGEMPEDPEGKKNWIQKMGASAGIATESLSPLSTYFTEGVDSIKNGFEVSDRRPPAEPGKCYFDEHPLIKKPIDAMQRMAENLLKMYKKNPELCTTALAGLALTNPAVRGIAIRAGMGVAELAIELTKGIVGTTKNHPFLMGAGALLGITGLGYATHLQLKENATYEEVLEFTSSLIEVDEIKEKIGEFIPDNIENKAAHLADVIHKKGGKIAEFCEHAFDNCADIVKEAIKFDTTEQICSMSKTGLGAFQSEFSLEKADNSLHGLSGLDTLCGKDKKSGVIGECLKKVESGTKMNEGDIYKLMQATKGTNIRIFPEGGEKETGRYIQFVVLDDNDHVTTIPRNICPNPALSETTQANLFVDFLYDPSSANGLEKGITKTGKGLRKLASDILEGSNKEGGWNKFFSIGGSIVSFGTKAFLTLGEDIIQIPLDTALDSGKMNLQTSEGWCEFGGSMMPIVVVGMGIKMIPFLGTTLKFVTIKPLAAGANSTLKNIGESMNFSLIEKSFGQTKLDLLNKKLLSSHSYLEKTMLEWRIRKLEGKEIKKQNKFYGKLTVDDLELKKKEILSQQEKELDKIAEKHGNTPEADRKFADLSARNNAAIEELEKIAKNLEAKNLGKELPHPKINLKAIEGVKIRGRGLVAIASALGLMYLGSKVVDAIKGPDSGTYRTKTAEQILEEASKDGHDDEEIDYFGYDQNIETTQNIHTDGELLPVSLNTQETGEGSNEFICENSREFEIKMAQISMEYQGDMDVFLEKVNDKSASIEDINRAGESHEKHVEYTKKLIGNNKGMLKDFWKDKMKENGIIDEVIPEQLKQQGFKAFMAIFHREGTFQLEHMNKQDLKNVLTKILDESKKSGWAEGGKIAFSLIPYAGNIVAASDAVDDFKNGNIGSGMWNVGWCVGGLALDVFSFGTAGTAARAVKAGAKIGTKIAVNTVGHTGIMIGGQMIQQYFDHARSESIDIDTLPETRTSHNSTNSPTQSSPGI